VHEELFHKSTPEFGLNFNARKIIGYNRTFGNSDAIPKTSTWQAMTQDLFFAATDDHRNLP